MSARMTEENVAALAEAMWQLLNDMGANGQSVCLAAKAKARLAYEPFREEPEAEEGIMSLGWADSIIRGVGLLPGRTALDKTRTEGERDP